MNQAPNSETGDPAQLLAVARTASLAAPPILLLRHAARDSLIEASVSAAVKAALTNEGRDEAVALGARIPRVRAVRLYHSPVERCAETADLLAEGIRDTGGQAQVVGQRDYLGAPFLRDPKLAISRFADLGMSGFVRAWVNEEVPEPIAAPYRKAAGALLAALIAERDATEEALHLHVGHDLTVITLVGLSFDISDRGFPWPGYLDGCALIVDGGQLLCHYMGVARPIRE